MQFPLAAPIAYRAQAAAAATTTATATATMIAPLQKPKFLYFNHQHLESSKYTSACFNACSLPTCSRARPLKVSLLFICLLDQVLLLFDP